MIQLGPQIARSVAAKPDGLLRHEDLMFSLFPLHVGMRQYWRDFASRVAWRVSHQQWWVKFLKDSGGTGFWHETYFMRGGMEAIYDDLPAPQIAFTARLQKLSRRAGGVRARAAPGRR